MEFYICKHCGNIIAYAHKSGVDVQCCGEKMVPLHENTTEASTEKHIPVVTRDGNKVTVSVGSIEHPMEASHYIEWIALSTKSGNQRKELRAGDKPQAEFYIAEDDEIIKVLAYCNLHGLWSTSL